MFLLSKYRGALLQQYQNIKKQIPESNYQTICLDLDKVEGTPCINGTQLRSVQEIPNMLAIGSPMVYANNFFAGNFNLVSRERMKYVGSNKYLKDQIYVTIAPDRHLYFKSCNPQLFYLQKVRMTGIFEDVEEANKLSCDGDNSGSDTSCYVDSMDKEFPLEVSLIPNLIQAVLKDILGAAYRPQDSSNNAEDDLANLAYFLSKNLKSDLAKKIDGSDTTV